MTTFCSCSVFFSVTNCYENVLIRRFKTGTSRTTWASRSTRQVVQLFNTLFYMWIQRQVHFTVWFVFCGGHPFLKLIFNIHLYLLGYGRPGPKGDRGDPGFASSSGKNRNLDLMWVTCGSSSNRNHYDSDNEWTLLFLKVHITLDHQDHLGLLGLKDLQVIRFCTVTWASKL